MVRMFTWQDEKNADRSDFGIVAWKLNQDHLVQQCGERVEHAGVDATVDDEDDQVSIL